MGPSSDADWSHIWKAEVPPKVKHFFWQLASGSLPTRGALCERHCSENDSRLVCNSNSEFAIHALFMCHGVRQIWESLAGYWIDVNEEDGVWNGVMKIWRDQ